MSKEKTESVKISVSVMDKVRKKKEDTGIPLIRIVEQAILKDLNSNPLNPLPDAS